LPYDENVALTRKVSAYAHSRKELCVVGGRAWSPGGVETTYPPSTAITPALGGEDFVKKTGVDSLAISIGTSHGRAKFKPEQCHPNAEVSSYRLPCASISWGDRAPNTGFPIVLHGSSSVPIEYVRKIEQFGEG
jgi:fructose-bisphosphate aldolase class II